MTTPEMNTNFDRKNEKARGEEDKDPHSAATTFLSISSANLISSFLNKNNVFFKQIKESKMKAKVRGAFHIYGPINCSKGS